MADFEIIDGDGHVPPEMGEIVQFFSTPYRGMDAFAAQLPNDPLRIGTGRHFHRAAAGRTPPMKASPEEWMSFLDETGISQAVLYPTTGLSIGMVTDVDFSVAFARAYNDWLHERYLKRSDRLKGVALLPIADVDESIAELRRAVTELGMIAAMIPSNGQALGKHLGARMYWPLYEEAERLDCLIGLHGGVHHNFGLIDTYSHFYPGHALGHPFGLLTHCAGMISHGVFDKFPRLRVAYLEGGAFWVPFLMERLDRSFATVADPRFASEPLGPSVEEKPSLYIKRLIKEGRLAAGFDLGEEMLSDALRRAGREGFLYASDYPHEAIDAKSARHEIDELLERDDLDEADKRAVLGGNAKRLYRLS